MHCNTLYVAKFSYFSLNLSSLLLWQVKTIMSTINKLGLLKQRQYIKTIMNALIFQHSRAMKYEGDHVKLTWWLFEHTFPIKYGDLYSIRCFNNKEWLFHHMEVEIKLIELLPFMLYCQYPLSCQIWVTIQQVETNCCYNLSKTFLYIPCCHSTWCLSTLESLEFHVF
jgi:hypothetical protein